MRKAVPLPTSYFPKPRIPNMKVVGGIPVLGFIFTSGGWVLSVRDSSKALMFKADQK